MKLINMFTLTAIAAVTLTGCGGGDDKPKAEKKTLEQQVQSQEVTSAPQTIEIEVPIKQGTKINVPTVAGFTAHAKQGRTVEAPKTVAGKTVNHQAVSTTVWSQTAPAGKTVLASTSSITPKTLAGKTITAWEGTTTIAPTVVAGKTVTVSGNKALLATAPAIVPSPMAQATPQIAPSEQGTPVAKAQGIPSEQQVIPTKAKQGKPAIPAANTQLTPNAIPAAKAKGTPEIPDVIAQGTPSENITKSKQGKPQVTETRQAIDASQQAIIEVAEYAAARDVALLPQQTRQLRDVVKSDNSPEAVAAAVAHAKDVVNVQAAQVATEAFMASQGIPTPYAVPTAQVNKVPAIVATSQGAPEVPVAREQGTPIVQPEEVAQGTPLAQPQEVAQGTPLAQPQEVTQGTPLAQPQEVTQSTPLAQPQVVAQGTPLAQPQEMAQGTPTPDPRLVRENKKAKAVAAQQETAQANLLAYASEKNLEPSIAQALNDKFVNLVEAHDGDAQAALEVAKTTVDLLAQENSTIATEVEPEAVQIADANPLEDTYVLTEIPEVTSAYELNIDYSEGLWSQKVDVPMTLTTELIQQQAEKLDSVCLTNTQDFVKSTGGTLNTLGGNNFQEIKTDLTSDEDRLSYSMEIFAMLQQALADNPDLQQAIAQQHAGGSNKSHVKATWTLSMDTGASYTLSTHSSQAYQPSIEVVVNSQGAVVVKDGNGIELARIVSTAQNGNCEDASYDVVIANSQN